MSAEPLSEALFRRVADAIMGKIEPDSDLYASADYRRRLGENWCRYTPKLSLNILLATIMELAGSARVAELVDARDLKSLGR